MSGGLEYFKTPTGILKILEIISVIVSVGLFRAGPTSFGNVDANYFGIGIMVTALIVTPLLLLCYLMGRVEIQQTIFEAAYNCLMFLLLGCAGAIAMDYYVANDGVYDHAKEKDEGIALASFCLLAALIYLCDTVLAVIEYRS